MLVHSNSITWQAVNHGIPEELLNSVVSKGREMFALPKAQKAKFKVDPCLHLRVFVHDWCGVGTGSGLRLVFIVHFQGMLL